MAICPDPSLTSTAASALPGIVLMIDSICAARRWFCSMLLLTTLMPRSVLIPLSASSSRICSGCVNEISRPGITASTESNTVTSPSWSFAVVHSSCGLRMTYMSPSNSPIASVARSGRPSLVTTVTTSGNFRMMRSACCDSRVASSSEMDGSRREVIRIDPSLSLGMNSVPIQPNEATAMATSTTDTPTIWKPRDRIHSNPFAYFRLSDSKNGLGFSS